MAGRIGGVGAVARSTESIAIASPHGRGNPLGPASELSYYSIVEYSTVYCSS